MPISIIIPPPTTHQAPPKSPQTPLPKPETAKPAFSDWQDYAAQEDWENAVLALVRTGWGRRFTFWRVVNAVVAESQQPNRAAVRRVTRHAMMALLALVRKKKITRYRKRWVGIEFATRSLTTPVRADWPQ